MERVTSSLESLWEPNQFAGVLEAIGYFPQCFQQQILTETVPGPLFVLKAATVTIAINSREDYISALLLLLLCQMEKVLNKWEYENKHFLHLDFTLSGL